MQLIQGGFLRIRISIIVSEEAADIQGWRNDSEVKQAYCSCRGPDLV